MSSTIPNPQTDLKARPRHESAPSLPSHAADTTDTVADRRPKFPRDDAGFHAELQKRVSEVFRQTGRAERDCWQMYLKTAIVLAWTAASYGLLVFAAQTWWQALPLAVSLAFAMAAIGFNIQHDGGHGAYSRRPWVNKLAAMTLDLIGASSYLWHWKHVVIHHTYVNVSGVDTDIELGGAVRLTPHQPWRPAHRWQHLYLFPLYGIMAARWHMFGDLKDVFAGHMGPHRIPRPKGRDLAVFIGGKAVSTALLLGLPMIWHSWWVVLLFYLFVTGVLGVVLSIVFQLAHCVEEADFPIPAADTLRLQSAFAVHQVQTTVDFAHGSRVLAWYMGGLNYQIEHHLFPRICHIHYPAIAPIVEATCREYGVKYSVHPTFVAGVRSHYRWLWRMGHPDAARAEPGAAPAPTDVPEAVSAA